MKKILLIILLFLISNAVYAKKEFLNKVIDGKTVQIIKVTLDGEHKVIASISEDGDTFENLLKKEGADTGINGAYFMPMDYGFAQNDTNVDRVYKGRQYFKYDGDFGARGLMGFKKNGAPIFILNDKGYSGHARISHNFGELDEVEYGISNHPVLLLEGVNVLSNSEDLIDAKMRARGVKSFICHVEDGTIIYLGNVSNVTIYELPNYILNNFGCHNAIGLDNGGSMGFMYNGTVYRKPGRKIMDAFIVVKSNGAKVEKIINKDEIAKISKKKISRPRIKINPLENITRAEMIKIVIEAFGHSKGNTNSILFKDVDKSSIYAPYLAKAIELGIISGNRENGTFKPNVKVNRSEALKMILISAGIKVKPAQKAFNDIQYGAWFASYVNYASKIGIISGDGNGNFRPLDLIYGSELAKMIVLTLKLVEE